MATGNAIMVSLEEYLDTSYRPDRDWVDGELRERELGEEPHTSIQGVLSHLFRVHGKAWGVWAFPEQRVQTSHRRYRIADVCVVLRSVGFQPIVRTPPLLCVEVLSRGDRMSTIQERIDDYRMMGVGTVWAIDPLRRAAFSTDQHGAMVAVQDVLTVPGTAISITLTELFEELNELEGLV